MVAGYEHLPGNHCGSTALRNMLAFHGVEVSEAMAFGLGAGACFFYIVIDGQSPSRFTNGRTSRLEETFVELTGTPFRLRTAEDPEESWRLAAGAVDEGRPALLLTDLFHLDHYGNSAHFPGHAVVLAGYDDELAYLSDTGFEDLQETRLENLALARHEGNPIFPLAGHMFDLSPGEAIGELASAIPAAIERAAQSMLEPELGEYQGIPALERLAAEVGEWPQATEDWQWCARFLYQVIERRGTGGGNFRRMYAGFLEEAGRDEASLAADASARWTELAGLAKEASSSETADPGQWRALGEAAGVVLASERELWERLAS